MEFHRDGPELIGCAHVGHAAATRLLRDGAVATAFVRPYARSGRPLQNGIEPRPDARARIIRSDRVRYPAARREKNENEKGEQCAARPRENRARHPVAPT